MVKGFNEWQGGGVKKVNIETVGARLKKIRQERGLTLEEMQKKTKMHLNILRAIEGDSLSDLSPVYLKGFIKIYCNHLGLDAQEYLGPAVQTLKPVLHATVGRGIGERVESKSTFIKDTSKNIATFASAVHFKRLVVIVVLVVMFIFLIINGARFIGKHFRASFTRAKISLPVLTPKPAKERLAKDTKSTLVTKNNPVVSKSAKDELKGFTCEIFARNKSWVSAKVDGKLRFHGLLTPGRTESWQAKEKIELSLGDSGAIEIQVNDQRFTHLGRRGQSLKNILINKDGLKIAR